MTATEAMFLESLSPSTRKVLVSERIAGMRGQLREVCDRLKVLIAATAPDKHLDIAALGMLWSEMLHLDGQDADGLLIFNKVVEPHLPSLPVAGQLVAMDNLSCIQMSTLHEDAASYFYHLVDRRRVAQFEATQSKILIAAQIAIEKERLTEAFPLLWQSHVRAYSLGSWRALRQSAERLAKLYLKAGALEEACHYLILAEADKEMQVLAAAVSHRGDTVIIRSILRRLMDFANLQRHFIVACKFVAKIPDLIPDADVVSLAEWLLPRCRELGVPNGGGAMRAAWEAIRELGHRLPQATSRSLIETALSHPDWQSPLPGENRFLPNRKVIVEAVTSLAYSAPKECLPEIAEAALPLATERIQDYDYGEVVNLLCNLSRLGGEVLRNKISNALYVPGKPISRMLAQVAGIFEVDALTSAQWEAFANKIIEETRLTVQRLNPGETPKPVGETLCVMTKTTSMGQLNVTVHSGVGIEALIRGKQHLTDPTIERIIRVLLEMVMDQDNLLSNQEVLLSQMCGFADRAGSDLRDEVIRTLEPLIHGTISKSSEQPNEAVGVQPPLSDGIVGGTLQQVQAMALIAVATFCGSDTDRFRQISEALLEGFVSPHVAVRRGAYKAARRLNKLSSEQLIPILMGLRDPDPDAAVAAFAAFAARPEWVLTRPMWKMFLLGIRLAGQSPNSNLRRHAALALRARCGDAPTESTRSDAQAIKEVFSNDIAYSVRMAITG